MSIILTKRCGGNNGGSGINLLIANEAATGEKNGINKIFETAYSYLIGTLSVYYNGQRLIKGSDYREDGPNGFQLIYVKPYSDDNLIVDYQISL